MFNRAASLLSCFILSIQFNVRTFENYQVEADSLKIQNIRVFFLLNENKNGYSQGTRRGCVSFRQASLIRPRTSFLGFLSYSTLAPVFWFEDHSLFV